MTRLALFAGFLLSAAVLVLAQAPTRQAQQFPQPPPARDVTVTAIHGVIDADERWIEAWHGTDNADGIVGTSDGGLLFAQEQPSRVSKLDQKDRVSVFVEQTHGAGALAFDGRAACLRCGARARTRA